MKGRFLGNDVAMDMLITPILSTSTTDIDGSSIDMAEYGDATIMAAIGVSLDTLSGSVMVEMELEHSDDDSSWSDCADTDIEVLSVATGAVQTTPSGTNPATWAVVDGAADDDAMFAVRYIGDKRYIRPVANKTGTHTNGIPVSAFAMRINPKTAPAA